MLTREMLRSGSGLPELYTDRVRLRQLQARDYPALERMLSDPLVIRYVNRIRKPADARMRRLVAQIRVAADSLDSLHFAVEWQGGIQQQTTNLANLMNSMNAATRRCSVSLHSSNGMKKQGGAARLYFGPSFLGTRAGYRGRGGNAEIWFWCFKAQADRGSLPRG